MVDATSKIPSGLLSLNFGEMGDFDQCVKIETKTTNTGTILGKYCLGSIVIKNNKVLGDLGDIKVSQVMPVWALCLPNGCTTSDTNTIGNVIFETIFGNQVGITFTDPLCQTINEVNPDLTPGAIVTMYVQTYQKLF